MMTAAMQSPTASASDSAGPAYIAGGGIARPRRPAVLARIPWEWLGWGVLVAAFLLGFGIAVARVVGDGCTDFTGFCKAGRHVLEHGSRDPTSCLIRYWPSADVPWVFFALLPLPLGAAIWYAVGTWSWFGLLRTIHGQLLAGDDPASRHSVLVAGLLAAPLAIDGLCLGSFHVLMVWLMAAGLLRACRGRTWSGGLLLGLASWLKLLPLLGVGYLLLKRRWGSASLALGFTVLFDVVLSLAAFGPGGAWREHAAWWHRGVTATMYRQLARERVGEEDRPTNQSLAVTVRRLLSSHGNPMDPARRRVILAELTPQQLQAVFLGTTALLAAGIAAFCRRDRKGSPPRQGSDELPAQIALVVLATLWFSPVVWSYHLTAATPALAVVLYRCRHHQAVAWAVIGVWLTALSLLACPVARAAGILFWLSLLLGLALVRTRPAEPAPQ